MTMQNSITVSVQGTEELRRNFSELKKSAQVSVIRSALRGAGRAVVLEARRRVPVDTGTGKRAVTLTVDRERTNRNILVATIGFTRKAYYLAFHELGTVHMAANPFLRPALANSTREILKAFFDTMGKRIGKIRAKANG